MGSPSFCLKKQGPLPVIKAGNRDNRRLPPPRPHKPAPPMKLQYTTFDLRRKYPFSISGHTSTANTVVLTTIEPMASKDSAFHPSLAPVGVLLAVFGYVAGNYGGYICGLLMQWVAP